MRFLVFLVFLVFAIPTSAQQVIQSGKPLPGHAGKWITNLTLGDAGPAYGGPAGTGLTELNITSNLNNGLPFCINDAPTTGPFHQLCLGAGGTISYQALGGASPLPLNCAVNGANPVSCLSASPTLTPPMWIIDNKTGAMTADYSTLTVESQANLGNAGLYGLPQYAAVTARLDMPSGSMVQNASGFLALVTNHQASQGQSGNAVGFNAITNAAVNGAQTWGVNTVNNTSDPAGTGKVLSGYEADFGPASPNDAIRAIGLYGNAAQAFSNTTDVRAIEIGSLSVQNQGLARWSVGLVCEVAAIVSGNNCIDIEPEAIGGRNTKGPSIAWYYNDGAGNRHYYSIHAENNQLNFTGDVLTGMSFEVPLNVAGDPLNMTAGTGPSLSSPTINWYYTDSGSVSHYYSIHADGATSTLFLDSDLHQSAPASLEIETRLTLDGPVIRMTALPTAVGPGNPVCVNSSTGQLYKATATTC